MQCDKMDELPSISHKKNELEMQFEQIKKNVTMNNAKIEVRKADYEKKHRF